MLWLQDSLKGLSQNVWLYHIDFLKIDKIIYNYFLLMKGSLLKYHKMLAAACEKSWFAQKVVPYIISQSAYCHGYWYMVGELGQSGHKGILFNFL